MSLTLTSPPTVLNALVAWFRRQRETSELANLDADEAQRLATDLNVSLDDLISVAGQSADEAELMSRMMAAHGISRAAVEAELPALVRSMAVTCAKCTCKGECSHDLDAGTAPQNAARYCPNTDSIQSLLGH